jgi:polar amino acid transport system substrate-binding protein
MSARALALGLAATLSAAACGPREAAPSPPDAPHTASAPAPACTLTVGWDPWEPYQYQDATGAVSGLDIDIVSVLAGDVGCTVDYRRGEWLELLGALREGTIDLLLAATPLPEREDFARFTEPYRQESFALFVRAEDLPALRSLTLAELVEQGRRIGITEGYYYGPEINELAYSARYAEAFVAVPVVELNYMRLVDGSIDALLDDPVVAASVIRRKGWSGRIVRHPHAVFAGDVALMFSRASVSPQTIDRFNEALHKRKAAGDLEELLQRYQPG